MPQQVKHRPALLDSLEGRTLFSSINVTDFGAVPDDGHDDTGAIIAAINASKPGDTIVFAGGDFHLNTDIKLASNRSYIGSNHAEIVGATSVGSLFDIKGDNVTVSGLIFTGGGIFLDRNDGNFNNNIHIDHNVFNNGSSGPENNGITFTSGLRNSVIEENYFTGRNAAGFGIYGYNYNGLTIQNNDFVNIQAGVHIQAFYGSGNLLVQNNFIHGARGMGLEFQGNADGCKFIGNWYEHPDLSSDFSRNMNSFAFSLILDGSKNILITKNVIIAPERPDGAGCRIGIEVGGDNTLVTGNYINGVNCPISPNDGLGSASVTIANNYINNNLLPINGIRMNAVTFKGSNDGGTVLGWSPSDIDAGRIGRKINIILSAIAKNW